MRSLTIPLALTCITACSTNPGTDDAAPASDASIEVDAGDPLGNAREAARAAAHSDPACTAIAPFYWEIGDVEGELVAGAEGSSYSADTEMDIASGSKWIFGAYVVERFRDDVPRIDHAAMTMMSGYVSLGYLSCRQATTVSSCFSERSNDDLTPDAVGRFHYDGGHFQKYAVDLGLGDRTSAELTADITAVIGDFDIGYSSPQLAAGVSTTPAGYARFLRAILAGDLAIRDHLGAAAVCTLPGPSCPQAQSSPVATAWHYSYGHWIEDDATGDGAFSSPGAFGFYPWIDAGKRYYGIVARHERAGSAAPSAACGRIIRTAFLAAAEPHARSRTE